VEAARLEREDGPEVLLRHPLEEAELFATVLKVLLDFDVLAGEDVPDAEADDLAVVGVLLQQLTDDEAVAGLRAHQLLGAIPLAGEDDEDVEVFVHRQGVGQGFQELHAFLERSLALVAVLPGAELVYHEQQAVVAAEPGDAVVEVREALPEGGLEVDGDLLLLRHL